MLLVSCCGRKGKKGMVLITQVAAWSWLLPSGILKRVCCQLPALCPRWKWRVESLSSGPYEGTPASQTGRRSFGGWILEAWGPSFTSESSSFYLSSKGFWPLCTGVNVGKEGKGWQWHLRPLSWQLFWCSPQPPIRNKGPGIGLYPCSGPGSEGPPPWPWQTQMRSLTPQIPENNEHCGPRIPENTSGTRLPPHSIRSFKIFLAAQTFWPQSFFLPVPTMSLF